MLSNKPYLIRAFYDWIVDSRCTPQLVINANVPNCQVPKDYVVDGEIVFNISKKAVVDLKIQSKLIEFSATIAGIPHYISAPMRAILAIYAEENEEGMYFDPESEVEEEQVISTEKKVPHLTLVE